MALFFALPAVKFPSKPETENYFLPSDPSFNWLAYPSA